MRTSGAKRVRQMAFAALVLALAPRATGAAPDTYLPVGDPLEAELRLLDVVDPGPAAARLLLPRLHTRPLQWRELQGAGAPAESLDVVRAIAVARLERALGRNALPDFAPHPVERATPWLWRRDDAGQLVELSAGIEGAIAGDRFRGQSASGAGGRLRADLAFERWLAHADLILGRVDDARAFADPLFPGTDVVVHTEDTYAAYSGVRWAVRFGRSRWHWGPGEEASLLLSKTSAALTALEARARIEPLRADLIALTGTIDRARDEQFAAHRVEWRPHARLRIGLAEGVRYHAASWAPLYAVGLIPYTLVQRLENQDDPDSLAALRNNVLVSADLAWRPVSGMRLYGELLIDDLHAKSGATPNKLAYQLGGEGAGAIAGTRVSGGGEFTRISRFVYTSYFGRDWAAQDRPLGFPTGPDARRLSLRAAADVARDWQLTARVAREDRGESDLATPFVPGTKPPDPWRLAGVVERTRAAEGGLRWWPASGVDVAVRGGYRWVENDRHRAGVHAGTPTAAIELRLTR